MYVLDTPGVLVPNINDIETGLKLSLTGSTNHLGFSRSTYVVTSLTSHWGGNTDTI